MQGTDGLRRSALPPSSDVISTAELCARRPPTNISPGSDLVYDLRNGTSNSDAFYEETAKFAEEMVARIDDRAGSILDGYCRHLRVCNEETPRSRGEYALDFLTVGMALRRYGSVAQATSKWAVALAQGLIWLRRHVPILKAPADWLRSGLSRRYFLPSIQSSREGETFPRSEMEQAGVGSPLAKLSRLISWLRATGEYEQEAIRLRHWRDYLATLAPEGARGCMSAAVESFDDFAGEAASRLGTFTKGVSQFLRGEYARRGGREDQIFCGRPPVEYHLSMIAAELMNRGLEDAFEHTTRRVVLVPACMREAKAATCKARVHGVDVTCAACDPDCFVNRITQRMRKMGAAVYLIPHTTGFSRWLDRWGREPNVGVVAVACMLNILPGGYEMRSRGIASQCVPLDYPGCKKHWDREGCPTALNEDRLVQIVAGAGR